MEALLSAELRAIDAAAIAREGVAEAVRRVAIVTEAFLPKVDGVSRTALMTIRYLERTGRRLIVFAPAPAPPRVGETPVYSVPSLWLPEYPETRVALPWPPILLRLRRFRPDLIHLFSPFDLGSMGMLAGGLLGVPVIANYQTDLPGYAVSYGVSFLRRTFIGALRFIHNGCCLTLAPSPATLAELAGWRFRRLRLWGRGVDSERFNPAHRSEAWRARLLAGRDPARTVVLYVGRMAKEKHLETLRIIAHDPYLALTLVGAGEHQPAIARALKQNGGEAHFTGPLHGDDLAEAYAAADIFVFPGPEETFGQVVLEAMASGLPVIVTARGGPASMVVEGETGFICPVGDAAAFAARAHLLHDDPGRRARMGAAARRFAEAQPWTAVMRQLETYYSEVMRSYVRLKQGRIAGDAYASKSPG